MSDSLKFDEIGRIMAEHLKMLDEERGAVNETKSQREQAAKAEMEAEQRYAEKIQQVRDEGYVTDALLEKCGHKVGKRRGRPTKVAANSVAAPVATT